MGKMVSSIIFFLVWLSQPSHAWLGYPLYDESCSCVRRPVQIVYVSCVRLCYWLSLEARAINILSLWHLLLIRWLWPQSLCLCTEKCFTHLASSLKVWILFVSHLCTKSKGNIFRFAVLYYMYCFSFNFC